MSDNISVSMVMIGIFFGGFTKAIRNSLILTSLVLLNNSSLRRVALSGVGFIQDSCVGYMVTYRKYN